MMIEEAEADVVEASRIRVEAATESLKAQENYHMAVANWERATKQLMKLTRQEKVSAN